MKIGILGAGTMGLTLAYRLGKRGHTVTVFEREPQVGGLATWFDYEDFIWDKFYHVILAQDSSLRGLIEDLGIGDKLRFNETKSGFLWKGRHLSMSNNWEFITFPALSFFNKIRLGLGILRIQRIEDPSRLETITAQDWMIQMFGRSTYQAIWEPLIESKYGVLKDQVPATIMWATIKRYYSTRSKGAGKESMGFLSGGLKTFYDALGRAIDAQGGRILCAIPVDSIDEAQPRGVVLDAGGQKHTFDRVISTLPTAILRAVAPHLSELFGPEASRPKFLGVICMTLVLKRALSPYYVTNLIQKGFPFTGIIEISALTGPGEFGAKHLVMLPRYDVPESPWFEKSPQEIAQTFLDALKPTWPDIEDNLLRYYIQRERMVQALWINKPPEQVGPARSRSGRIWNVNAELAGRDTLNNNAIIRVADAVAEQFCQALESHGPPSPGEGGRQSDTLAAAE